MTCSSVPVRKRLAWDPGCLGTIYRTNGRSWAGAERLAVGGTPSRRAACRGTVSVVCAGVAVAGGVRHVRPRLYWNGPLGASHAQAVPTGDPHPLPSRIPSLGDRRGHVRLLSNPPTRTHARGNPDVQEAGLLGGPRGGALRGTSLTARRGRRRVPRGPFPAASRSPCPGRGHGSRRPLCSLARRRTWGFCFFSLADLGAGSPAALRDHGFEMCSVSSAL